MERKKNSSLWPKGDVIFADIVDLLFFKNNFGIRSLFLLMFVSLIFILFFALLNFSVINYDSWILLNWNIEFCDQILWLFYFIFKYILVWHSIILYYTILLYVYLNFLYFSVFFFFLDYVGLYLFIDAYFYSVVQNDLNFVYIFDVLSYYKYNYIYNKIYVFNHYGLIYSYKFFFPYDYRYLTIKSVIHNLFLVNFGTDSLYYFYDISIFNKIVFLKNNFFNFLDFGLVYKRFFSNLNFVSNNNYFNDYYMLKLLNEFFVNVVDAQYIVSKHFAENISLFRVKTILLFLIKMPYINFEIYSVIYVFFCDFINIIIYLINIYLLNILLYYNVVINTAIYNIGNLTDIICCQIFMFVIF